MILDLLRINAILAWNAHILPSENQECGKQAVLETLDDSSILVVIDWAMKFLQMRYREKQSNWFGKRGLSWYVSSVIYRDKSATYTIKSYVHHFDSCTQDWYTVVSILEDLFKTLKRDQPAVEKAFLRSDEAGCYHNSELIAAVQDIGKRDGIKFEKYDFSEPQYGKDVCDRILCPMKESIRRFCNEGHDVIRAKDMRSFTAMTCQGNNIIC